MKNKHWKLFVIRQSKRRKLCLKCVRMCLAAAVRPDPLESLSTADSLAKMGLLLRGRERRGEGRDWWEREEGREERGRTSCISIIFRPRVVV